jgi:hypothetical protein
MWTRALAFQDCHLLEDRKHGFDHELAVVA